MHEARFSATVIPFVEPVPFGFKELLLSDIFSGK
jgi:hypothetical protein